MVTILSRSCNASNDAKVLSKFREQLTFANCALVSLFVERLVFCVLTDIPEVRQDEVLTCSIDIVIVCYNTYAE